MPKKIKFLLSLFPFLGFSLAIIFGVLSVYTGKEGYAALGAFILVATLPLWGLISLGISNIYDSF